MTGTRNTQLELAILEPVQEWLATRDRLLSIAGKDLRIRSAEGERRATDWAKACRAHYRAIEKQRMALTQPLDDAKADLMRQERELAAGLRDLEKTLRASLADWRQQQEAARRAAEAEAQRKAMEAAERAEQGDQQAAAELEKLATPTRTAKAPGAAGYRRNYRYEVVDVGEIPRGFLAPDPCDAQLVRAHLKSLHEQGRDLDIPGLRCWVEETPILR